MNSTEEKLIEEANKLGVSLNDLYSSNETELQVRASYAECYNPLSFTNIVILTVTIIGIMIGIEMLTNFFV